MNAYLMYDERHWYLAFGETAAEAARTISEDVSGLSVSQGVRCDRAAYVVDCEFHALFIKNLDGTSVDPIPLAGPLA